MVHTNAQTAPIKPTIVRMDTGNFGLLLVRIVSVAHARILEVRLASIGSGNALGPWQSAGLFTNSRAIAINGLTAGTSYKLEVRAIGDSTGYSDWSDPVSHISFRTQ